MNTWIRVGLMAVLVALLLVVFGSGNAEDAGMFLGALGVVLLIVGLATGGWRRA